MECCGLAKPCLFPGVALLSPVVSKERFAEISGLEVGVVRGMLDRGYLPAMKIGRHRLVNLSALHAQSLACLAAREQSAPGR